MPEELQPLDIRIDVFDAPSYIHPPKAGILLKRGWRRGVITMYDNDTGVKIVSCQVYLPPELNNKVLERLLELST